MILIRILVSPPLLSADIPEWISGAMVGLIFPAEMNSHENGYKISSNAVLRAFQNSEHAESRAEAIEWWEKNIPSKNSINIPFGNCTQV